MNEIVIPEGSSNIELVTRKYGTKLDVFLVTPDGKRVYLMPPAMHFEGIFEAAREGYTALRLNAIGFGDVGMAHLLVDGDPSPYRIAQVEAYQLTWWDRFQQLPASCECDDCGGVDVHDETETYRLMEELDEAFGKKGEMAWFMLVGQPVKPSDDPELAKALGIPKY